jgi:predicted DNA-binding protein
MATIAPNSISLPNELLNRVRPLAESKGLSISELTQAAVESYVLHLENFDNMLRWGREYGKQIGITSEEDVELIANGEMTLEDLRRSA